MTKFDKNEEKYKFLGDIFIIEFYYCHSYELFANYAFKNF